MSHQWRKDEATGIRTCQVPGCGVQMVAQLGAIRSGGWRKAEWDQWGVQMLPCVDPKAKDTGK